MIDVQMMMHEWQAEVSRLLVSPWTKQWVLGMVVVYCGWKVVGAWLEARSRVKVWSQVPSCPEENWLLGQGLSLARTSTPWHTLNDWLAEGKGNIVRFRIVNRLAVILDDPWAIKRVIQTHFKAYPKDTAFSYGTFLSILGTGIVTSDGAHWQEQRLLMVPAFRIDLLEVVLPVARRGLDRLAVKLDSHCGTDRPIDLANEIRHLTLQVIGEAIMSLRPEDCDEVLAKTYLPIMEECNRRVIHRWRMYLPTVAWFQQEHRLAKLNGFLKNTLKQRWDRHELSDGSGDLLGRMIGDLKAKGEGWSSKVADQMCYELKTFLLAGHETSAAMLAWALYELLCHPDCYAKVADEAERLLKDDERTPCRNEVEEMSYTLAVLKETLRKYTVVPNVCRELALDEDELCGYTIPKGTMIILSLKGVHERYKNPTEFNPDRFLPGGEYDNFDDEIRPFMFLPFIQGPRNCLGQYFALLEARYVLAYLIKNYEFTLVDAIPLVPGDMIPEAPRDGLNLLMHRK